MEENTKMATTGNGQSTDIISMGFSNAQSFEHMQRVAKMLASSTLVPTAYKTWDEKKGDNPNAIPNCIVALNMSQRMGADPLMVMQNLYIVEGRPSWSSQWIIAAINGCGRFSPLRFELTDLGEKEVEYEVTKWVERQRTVTKHKAKVQNIECIAWAVEQATGERIDSPKVSIEMAVMEGWYGKNGSKWQTMPELMLRYRTASFFGKLYAPELLMGIQSFEEAHDIIEVEQPDGTIGKMRAKSVIAKKANAGATIGFTDANIVPENVDPATGEVKPEETTDPDENTVAGETAAETGKVSEEEGQAPY
jgi:hypothetical protein